MNTESQLKSNTAAEGTRGKSPPMRMVLEEKSGHEGFIVGIGHDGCSASPNSQRKQVDETCKLLGAECRKLDTSMTCDAATQCAQLDEPTPALQRQRRNSFRLASPSKPVCLEDKLGCSLSQLDMEGTTTRSSLKLIDYSRRKAAVKQGDLAKTPRFIHMREKQPRRPLNEAILDLEGALGHDATSTPADRTKPVFPFKRRSLQRKRSNSLRLMPATTKPIADIQLSSSLSFIDHLEEPDQESESLSTSSNHKATFLVDPCKVDASDEESIQLSELDESIHLESLDEMETSNLPERSLLLNRKRSNSFRLPPITKPVPLQDKLGCSLSVLDLLEDKCPGIPPIRFQVRRRSSVTKQSTQTLNRGRCRTPASSSGENRGASFCKQSASTARLQNSRKASMVGSFVSPPEYWVKSLDLSLPNSDNTKTNGDADPIGRPTWSKSKSCSLLDIGTDAEDTTSPTSKKLRRRRNRRSRNSILDKKTGSHSPSRHSNMDRSWRNLMNTTSDKQPQNYTGMDCSSSHHFITGSRIRRYTNTATAATVSPTRDE